MSWGHGAWGPERAQGADPAPSRADAPRALPHQPSPRACTPAVPAGSPPQAGPLLTRPTRSSTAPSPSGSLVPLQGPPPHFPSGSSSFHILGAWGSPSSHPRSGSPSRPHRLPLSLEQPRASSLGHFAPLPGPGGPSLRESGEGSPVQDAGRPSLGCRGSPPFPRDQVLPPRPRPTAQRGRGRQSQAPAAFCSAWDGRDPARRFCRPGRVGDWVRGAASSRRPFLSLPVGRLPRSPAPWERPALPRGVRANRFLFATGVGPVSWRGRCSSLPQKPRQGPVETHSSAHGLRLGPFTVLLTCGRI